MGYFGWKMGKKSLFFDKNRHFLIKNRNFLIKKVATDRGNWKVQKSQKKSKKVKKMTLFWGPKMTLFGGPKMTLFWGPKMTLFWGPKMTLFWGPKMTLFGGPKMTPFGGPKTVKKDLFKTRVFLHFIWKMSRVFDVPGGTPSYCKKPRIFYLSRHYC